MPISAIFLEGPRGGRGPGAGAALIPGRGNALTQGSFVETRADSASHHHCPPSDLLRAPPSISHHQQPFSRTYAAYLSAHKPDLHTDMHIRHPSSHPSSGVGPCSLEVDSLVKPCSMLWQASSRAACHEQGAVQPCICLVLSVIQQS